MTWKFAPDYPTDAPDTWRVCDGFHSDRAGVYRTGFMATSYSDYGTQTTGIAGKAYRTTTGTLGIVLVCPHPVSPVVQVYDGSAWNTRATADTPGGIFSSAIAQFGNITLLGSIAGGLFSRDATGASNFAAVAGSPAGAGIVLVTPQNIVVTLAAIAGSNTLGTNVWAASDVGDYTNWSTGEAATNSLLQTPGVITAGVVLGSDVIAFKRRGVYRGQYIGGTFKWKWDLIDSTFGAWGPGAAVVADNKVYFYGDSGFCSFDGSRFSVLDDGIATTIARTIADPSGFTGANNRVTLKLLYDSLNRRVCIFNFGFLSFGNNVTRPSHFSYHLDSGLWGYQSRVKDEVDDSDDYSGVIDNAEELNSFSSGAWLYNTNIALVSSTNTDIRILSDEFTSSNCGTNYKPTLRTYRFGKRDRMTRVTRFVPGWTTSDGAGTDLSGATVKTVTPITSSFACASGTSQTAVTLSSDQYWADYTYTARWHNAEIKINCEACIDGGAWVAVDAGAA